VRMASILRLHREETYDLPKNASADKYVDAEVARRTFWVIECHDNLYTCHKAPLSFHWSDISTLLPSEESDFAFGRVTQERAALAGTQAAESNPELTSIDSRSIFATLIQVHNLWGQIARRACRTDRERDPWKSTSEFTRLTTTVREWEERMPARHRWSLWNFRGYKAEKVDLAYLSIVTITRLNYIVIRRIYLEDILNSTSNTTNGNDGAPLRFWGNVSYELFLNVQQLYESIDVFFCLRSPEDGFPAMLVFCVYMCGSLASYLWKWPQLCPSLSPQAEQILARSLEVLANLQHAWPMAATWLSALRKVAVPFQAKKTRPLSAITSQAKFLSAADGLHKEPDADAVAAEFAEESEHFPPQPPHPQHHESLDTQSLDVLSNVASESMQQLAAESIQQPTAIAETEYTYLDEANMLLAEGGGMHGLNGVEGFPTDNFETELSEFLQGTVHLGMVDGW